MTALMMVQISIDGGATWTPVNWRVKEIHGHFSQDEEPTFTEDGDDVLVSAKFVVEKTTIEFDTTGAIDDGKFYQEAK